jgi:hypothetical protein
MGRFPPAADRQLSIGRVPPATDRRLGIGRIPARKVKLHVDKEQASSRDVRSKLSFLILYLVIHCDVLSICKIDVSSAKPLVLHTTFYGIVAN